MAAKFKAGDTAYLIESNHIIREITMSNLPADFILSVLKTAVGELKSEKIVCMLQRKKQRM